MTSLHPRLSDDDFAHVVRCAPLVSIDMVIRDPAGFVLLGLRTNEPARDTHFVPGGVIRKNEPIADAFSRILAAETGLHAKFADAKPIGVFEHFYSSNRFHDPAFGTHYVALGYEIAFKPRPAVTVDSQHKTAVWMPVSEILSSANVHAYTKAYFC